MTNVTVEQDSSVSTVISYELDSRAVVVRLSLRGRNYLLTKVYAPSVGQTWHPFQSIGEAFLHDPSRDITGTRLCWTISGPKYHRAAGSIMSIKHDNEPKGMIGYDIFVNCSCGDIRRHKYNTHLHTNNTQKQPIKPNT